MDAQRAETIEAVASMVPVYMAVILHAMFVVIGAWDIFCWASGRPTDTVSAVISDWSHSFPPFTLAVGFVLGHLFWQSPPRGPR